ncbi:MAG TPA: hypothetical protein ENO21_01555 [Firmicutes bacterium]|nr:hypothetical protein [Bacillota bacterium]
MYQIIAGQHYLVGYVYIASDGTFLTVEVETIDGWEMSSTHLYVGNVPPDTGAPGQFPFQAEFDPWVTNYTYPPVPLADYNVEYKAGLYFAIHVDVHKQGQEETGWAGDWNNGAPSWDFGWADKWGGYMYDCLPPLPDLPTTPQEFTADRYGMYSYWDIMFTDQNLILPPGEFYIGDYKHYVGWCAENSRWMLELQPYLAWLYSSYDPNMPADPLLPITMNGNLEFVNYMINQRRNPDPGGPFYGVDWTIQDNYIAFQDAVWFFSDGMILGTGSLAEALAEYAMANGDNYIPCEGEWYSLVLYPDTAEENMELRPQMILIEVDP